MDFLRTLRVNFMQQIRLFTFPLSREMKNVKHQQAGSCAIDSTSRDNGGRNPGGFGVIPNLNLLFQSASFYFLVCPRTCLILAFTQT